MNMCCFLFVLIFTFNIFAASAPDNFVYKDRAKAFYSKYNLKTRLTTLPEDQFLGIVGSMSGDIANVADISAKDVLASSESRKELALSLGHRVYIAQLRETTEGEVCVLCLFEKRNHLMCYGRSIN